MGMNGYGRGNDDLTMADSAVGGLVLAISFVRIRKKEGHRIR
jgi:hypothetical protein